MTTPNPDLGEQGESSPLGHRIRMECARRSWDLGELAQRAGVARTTLYHLVNSHTSRPRATTLGKISQALRISPESLLDDDGVRGPIAPAIADDEAARFDRATNPLVSLVVEEQPTLFADWSADDWGDLYSMFGTGGHLSVRGVASAAESINRRRETVRQLHIVMETHLRDVAAEMIETLYRLAQPHRPRFGERSVPGDRQGLPAVQDSFDPAASVQK